MPALTMSQVHLRRAPDRIPRRGGGWFCAIGAASVLALGAETSCSRPKESTPTTTVQPVAIQASASSSPSPIRSSVVVPPAAAPKGASSATAPGAPRPLSPAERAALTEYGRSMARGQAATRAREWAKAFAAFDAALAARPGDPRAYAERGYARLLEGQDLPRARADLDRAASGTVDDKLLSQVWFNNGLVDERSDAAGEARVDFYFANRFAPSAAARAKLGAEKVCPVLLERPDYAAFKIQAPDWLLLWRALRALSEAQPTDGSDAPPPTTPAEAREALTGEKGEVKLPVIVRMGQELRSVEWVEYLVLARGHDLAAMELGRASAGRCPGEVAYRIVDQKGALLHVGGHAFQLSLPSLVCDDDGGEVGDLTPCETGGSPVGVRSFCEEAKPPEQDFVVDLTSARVLITLERPSDAVDTGGMSRSITVTLEPTGLRLDGFDCEGIRPFEVDGGASTRLQTIPK